MINSVDVLFVVCTYASVFILLLLGAVLGRRVGRWHLDSFSINKLVVIEVAEAAVFALLGLLVAFTFSGAYDRYQDRERYIIEEANAIHTAYSEVDLLPKTLQPALRVAFRNYINARMQSNLTQGEFMPESRLYNATSGLQQAIWSELVKGLDPVKNGAVLQVIVPSVQAMFDITNKRHAVTQIHPPVIVFLSLLILAMMSTFLIGYSTAEMEPSKLVHVWVYLVMTSFVIYVIMDLELPRIGFIKVNKFNASMLDIQKHINASE